MADKDETYEAKEIAKRRDQALLRALSMPPKLHKALEKKGGGTRKRRRRPAKPSP